MSTDLIPINKDDWDWLVKKYPKVIYNLDVKICKDVIESTIEERFRPYCYIIGGFFTRYPDLKEDNPYCSMFPVIYENSKKKWGPDIYFREDLFTNQPTNISIIDLLKTDIKDKIPEKIKQYQINFMNETETNSVPDLYNIVEFTHESFNFVVKVKILRNIEESNLHFEKCQLYPNCFEYQYGNDKIDILEINKWKQNNQIERTDKTDSIFLLKYKMKGFYSDNDINFDKFIAKNCSNNKFFSVENTFNKHRLRELQKIYPYVAFNCNEENCKIIIDSLIREKYRYYCFIGGGYFTLYPKANRHIHKRLFDEFRKKWGPHIYFDLENYNVDNPSSLLQSFSWKDLLHDSSKYSSNRNDFAEFYHKFNNLDEQVGNCYVKVTILKTNVEKNLDEIYQVYPNCFFYHYMTHSIYLKYYDQWMESIIERMRNRDHNQISEINRIPFVDPDLKLRYDIKGFKYINI